ncbi:hypothetical protein AAMO2058_001163900 [Amorphochlora amoebiformis]
MHKCLRKAEMRLQLAFKCLRNAEMPEKIAPRRRLKDSYYYERSKSPAASSDNRALHNAPRRRNGFECPLHWQQILSWLLFGGQVTVFYGVELFLYPPWAAIAIGLIGSLSVLAVEYLREFNILKRKSLLENALWCRFCNENVLQSPRTLCKYFYDTCDFNMLKGILLGQGSLSAILTLLIINLLRFHTLLAHKGITTYESILHQRVKYAKTPEEAKKARTTLHFHYPESHDNKVAREAALEGSHCCEAMIFRRRPKASIYPRASVTQQGRLSPVRAEGTKDGKRSAEMEVARLFPPKPLSLSFYFRFRVNLSRKTIDFYQWAGGPTRSGSDCPTASRFTTTTPGRSVSGLSLPARRQRRSSPTSRLHGVRIEEGKTHRCRSQDLQEKSPARVDQNTRRGSVMLVNGRKRADLNAHRMQPSRRFSLQSANSKPTGNAVGNNTSRSVHPENGSNTPIIHDAEASPATTTRKTFPQGVASTSGSALARIPLRKPSSMRKLPPLTKELTFRRTSEEHQLNVGRQSCSKSTESFRRVPASLPKNSESSRSLPQIQGSQVRMPKGRAIVREKSDATGEVQGGKEEKLGEVVAGDGGTEIDKKVEMS